MSSRQVAKRFYRTLVPAAVRNSRFVTRVKSTRAFHNVIYDADYYEVDVEGPAVASSATMAGSLFRLFAPATVVDVGCGTGALLAAFRDRGCSAFGLEYSKAGLARCRERGLDVQRFDLEHDSFPADRRFDLAVSVEVAEHLPERIADRYVDLLARLAPTVVFTAAPPGQEGADHVNLQEKQYWIDKFTTRGMRHDSAESERLARTWRDAGDVQSWYCDNLMLFRRGAS